MMTIEVKRTMDFEDLKDMVWAGAKDTIKTIEEHDKGEELMWLLEDIFCDEIPTETAINDLLWFDWEWLFESLDINEGDEE